LWDLSEPTYLPGSKFLKCSFSDAPPKLWKFLPDIKDSLKHLNNSTITKEAFPCNVKRLNTHPEVEQQSTLDDSKNLARKGFFPLLTQVEGVLHAQNDFVFDFSKTTKTDNDAKKYSDIHADGVEPDKEKRKKVPAKKEKRSLSIAERGIEISRQRAENQKESRLKDIETRRNQAKRHYAREFTAYLLDKLFSDKYLTVNYREELEDYVFTHYFSKIKYMEQAKNRYFNNLKPRIDLAAQWIARYKSKDGGKFDTTYFFPKAFLDVERSGKGVFSFTNTRKFMENAQNYERLNNYNRKLDKELAHKMHIISRKLENGFIQWDAALEKIKSLTTDTDEYVKQFIARHAGVYSVSL